MSETPRTGDRVRVTFESAEYVREGDPTDHDSGFTGHLVRVDGVLIYVPLSATVEVLERADDPAKNLPGTIRREDVGGSRHLWQALVIPSDPRRTRWVCIHAPGSSLAVGKLRDHHEVERFLVVGEAFGTPAWEDKQGSQRSLSEHGKREPRVYRPGRDGVIVPEPDDDINAVEDKHGDRLRRVGSGWIGEGGEGYPREAKDWDQHVLAKYAPYTEVWS